MGRAVTSQTQSGKPVKHRLNLNAVTQDNFADHGNRQKVFASSVNIIRCSKTLSNLESQVLLLLFFHS